MKNIYNHIIIYHIYRYIELRQNTLRHKSQQYPLWRTSQNIGNKSKNKEQDQIKLKRFCTTKETTSKVKRQPSQWQKIIGNKTTEKGLISEVLKQLLQLKSKKWTNQKMGQRTKQIYLQRRQQMANKYMKDAHPSLSEKCKSKPQWGTITCQSGWLPSKSLQAINAGEGVEKREPSYTVGGNAN